MKSPAYKVPYLGIKTSRLAVRWLYELIPELNIDISDYKIPIDKLVYRVASRLGIIDPTTENYSGDGSPADLKIQAFAKQAFPANAWYLDEPLWSTGRQVSRGGHCYPTNPNHAGCIFEDICPKHYPDTDPSERGMETTRKSRRTPKSSQHVAVTSDQRSFKAFIELLNTKKSHGKLSASEWREYRQLWFQRPQDRNELIERLNQL
jgi:hypothetical protein